MLQSYSCNNYKMLHWLTNFFAQIVLFDDTLTKLNIKKGSLSSNLHFTISSKDENFKYQNTIIGNNMFRIKRFNDPEQQNTNFRLHKSVITLNFSLCFNLGNSDPKLSLLQSRQQCGIPVLPMKWYVALQNEHMLMLFRKSRLNDFFLILDSIFEDWCVLQNATRSSQILVYQKMTWDAICNIVFKGRKEK